MVKNGRVDCCGRAQVTFACRRERTHNITPAAADIMVDARGRKIGRAGHERSCCYLKALLNYRSELRCVSLALCWTRGIITSTTLYAAQECCTTSACNANLSVDSCCFVNTRRELDRRQCTTITPGGAPHSKHGKHSCALSACDARARFQIVSNSAGADTCWI